MLNQPPSSGPRTARPAARWSVERPFEPRRIAVGLEQLQQPEPGRRSPRRTPRRPRPLPVAAQQRRGAASHSRDRTKLAARCGIAHVRRVAVEDAAGPCERGNHQPVPGGQHLVVQMRARALAGALNSPARADASCGAQHRHAAARWPRPRPRATAPCRAGSLRELVLGVEGRVAVRQDAVARRRTTSASVAEQLAAPPASRQM